MTKKHFRALAAGLHQNKLNTVGCAQREEYVDKRIYDAWLATINTVADVCASVNERFDRAKFIEACEKGL